MQMSQLRLLMQADWMYCPELCSASTFEFISDQPHFRRALPLCQASAPKAWQGCQVSVCLHEHRDCGSIYNITDCDLASI